MRVQKGLLAESYLIGRPSVLRSKQELQPAMENKNATRDRAPHIDAQLQQLSAYG